MSVFRTLFPSLALATCAALQGCGFSPIYERGSPGHDLLSQIEVAPIEARSGQILRNHLVDVFQQSRSGRADRPYILLIRLSESPEVAAIRRDDVISRGGYSASATFRLLDRAGHQIMNGSADLGSDFEIANSEHATAVARESARDRLMQYLAEEIRMQISTQHPAVNAPPRAR